jgi:hypothetical protein
MLRRSLLCKSPFFTALLAKRPIGENSEVVFNATTTE